MARVLDHIVEQHAESAAFLWLLRDGAVDAPHFGPAELLRLEARIEANLDGLRVAGEAGWEVAMAALQRHRESGELFAAAVLALETQSAERTATVIDMAQSFPDARRGLSGAIGWVAPARLRQFVAEWAESADPVARHLAALACSHHRADPGPRLQRWLGDPATLVRSRALRLVGELGRSDLRGALSAALADEQDQDCRTWAAWSGALVGEPAGVPWLLAWAEADATAGCPGLEAGGRLGEAGEIRSWVRRLAATPEQRRLAVRATAVLADPVVVPWLIERAREPDLALSAGESITLITGVDLWQEGLVQPVAAEQPAEPGQDGPTSEDEGLPRPEPALLGRWWERNSARFTPGVRHLLGVPVSPGACTEVFGRARQRQRRAAAYELACLRPDARLPSWAARMRPGAG